MKKMSDAASLLSMKEKMLPSIRRQLLVGCAGVSLVVACVGAAIPADGDGGRSGYNIEYLEGMGPQPGLASQSGSGFPGYSGWAYGQGWGGGAGGGAGVTGGAGGGGIGDHSDTDGAEGGSGGGAPGVNGWDGGSPTGAISRAGGGGGGGAHGLVLLGSGGATIGGVTGGRGGSGGDAIGGPASDRCCFGGGGGGGGGFGITVTNGNRNLVVSGNITAGRGGHGGVSMANIPSESRFWRSGSGGNGGTGLHMMGNGNTVIVQSGVTISGGSGGNGGPTRYYGPHDVVNVQLGEAGHGGTGIVLQSNNIVHIQSGGAVSGGSAGTGWDGVYNGVPYGGSDRYFGGIGISGEGSNNTLILEGTLSAGSNRGMGAYIPSARGIHTFELRSTGSYSGYISGSSGSTFILGGTGEGSFNTSNIDAAISNDKSVFGFLNFKKTGSSQWNLSGSSNKDWIVEEGTLRLNSNDAVRHVTLYNGTDLILSGSGTYSGAIQRQSGTANVSKIGSGTATLTFANSYTGTTTVSGGTLALSGNGSIASSSQLYLNGGSTGFDISNISSASTSVGALLGSGSISLGVNRLVVNGTNTVFSGVISGASSANGVTFGGGTTVLTGNNTYTGSTIIQSGAVLQLGTGGSSGAVNGDIQTQSTGTVRFNRSNFIYNGVVSGGGILQHAGNSTLTLRGANTHTGRTAVTGGGTLALAGNGSIANAAYLDLTNGSFDISGINPSSATIKGLQGDGNIQLGTKKLIIQGNNTTYGGVISSTGTGNAVEFGGGATILTGENTYTGTTTVVVGATLQLGNNTSTGSVIGNIDNAGTVAFARNGDFEYNSSIIGDGGVKQVGTSKTFFTNAQTYKGKTVIDAGTLGLKGLGSVADSSSVDVKAGGEFDISGISGTTATIKGLEGAGYVTLGNKTLRLTSSGTWSGDIRGAGNVEFGSTLTQILLGENTFTGQASILDNGTLQLGNGGSSGSILDGNISLGTTTGGTLIINRSGTISLGGILSGPGNLTKMGSGDLVLLGNNTFSGLATVQQGNLTIGGGSTDDRGALAANVQLGVSTSSLTFNRASEWTYGGTVTGVGRVYQDGTGTTVITNALTHTNSTVINAGTLQVGNGGAVGSVGGTILVQTNGTLAYNRSDNIVLTNVTGAGNVRQMGGGTLEVNAAQVYTGKTFVQAGTFALTGAGSVSASSNVDVSGASVTEGAIFDITAISGAEATITSLSGNTFGKVVRDGKALQITNGAGNFAGVISGTADVRVTGGAQTLSGNNDYTGKTSISNGASLLLAGTGIVSTSSEINASGLFNISAVTPDFATIETLTGDASGSVVLGDKELRLANASGTFSGAISGTGAYSLVSGSHTLAGVNTYAGVTRIADGTTLNLSGAGQVSDSAIVNVLGTFDISGKSANALVKGLSGDGGVTLGNQELRLTGVNMGQQSQFAGIISGAGSLYVAGGEHTLTNDNAFIGGTTIANGATLQLGNLGTTGTVTGSALVDGTLRFNYASNVFDGQIIPNDFAGVISGAGQIVVNGAGTVRLSANSSGFAGSTDVVQGSLWVNGQLGGNVAVQSDGILGGTGTIGGNVTFTGGKLAAGNSPGTLNVAGNLTLDAATVSVFELGAPGVVGGANNDLVNVSGALTLNGELQVIANNAGLYRLFNAGSVVNGSAFTSMSVISGTMAGSNLSIYQINDTVANITQVNLVIAGSGQQVQFWDGTDMTGDGTVQGGNGTWDGTNTNWTQDPAYNVNALWAGSVARFTNVAGTVTVVGTQKFDTLMFEVDGYNLVAGAGGQLQLDGDGKINVANNLYTATVSVAIADGSTVTGLVKQGDGRLILAADNTYTGTTLIENGSLQIGWGGLTGSVLGPITNNAELRFSRDATYNYANVISGTGNVTVAGPVSSSLELSGVQAYTGFTDVSTGSTLALIGNGSIASSSFLRITTADGAFDVSGITGASTQITRLLGTGSVVLGDKTLEITGAFGDTYNGVISGVNGSFHLLSGTQTLTGVSTFSGDTLIANNAQLNLNAGGSVTPSRVVANGAFNISGITGPDAHIRDLTGAGTGVVTLGNKALYVDNAAGTFAGKITGAGNFIVAGGTQTLSGLNDYTGPTSVSSNAALVVNAGTLVSNIQVTGDLTFARNDNWSYAGVLTGTGDFFKTGTGTVTLTGDSSAFAGNSTISGGTLLVQNKLSSTTASVHTAGTLRVDGAYNGIVNVNNGGTLAGKGTVTGNVTVASGGVVAGGQIGALGIDGNLTLQSGAGAAFTLGETGIVGGTHNDLINVSGALSIDPTSTLTVDLDTSAGGTGYGFYRLFTANNVSGDFGTINLTIDGAAAPAAVASTYKNAPGTAVQLNLAVVGSQHAVQYWDGSDTLGDGTLTPGAGIWTANSTNWTVFQTGSYVNAPWKGSVGVFEAPGGLVTVDGPVNFDILQFNAGGYILQPALGGGVLTLAGTDGNGNVGAATINVQAGQNVEVQTALQNGTTTDFIKDQGGVLTLSGVNTYTGTTTIAGGTLALLGGGSISTSSNVIANGTFDITGTTTGASIKTLSGTGTVALGAKALTLTNASSLFSGNINGINGQLIVDAGMQTLTGQASHTGLTTIKTNAELRLGNGGATGMVVNDILVEGVLSFNHNANIDYHGIVSGAGDIQKIGTGRTAFTNDSSAFAGTTTVRAGDLAINGTLGGSVFVENNGQLSGVGKILGDVDIRLGGVLAAGNSPGTLTIDGDLTLAQGSHSIFELNESGIVGNTNDLVNVGGDLKLNGKLTANAASAGYYRLFNFNGDVSGAFSEVNANINGTAANGLVYNNAPEIAEQVNIAIVGTGQLLQFWDGTDTYGDGSVQGGNGTWNNVNTNWTAAPGRAEVNAGWTGSVAVFDSVGGDVEIVGVQNFDTMQFNVNGYTLNPSISGGGLAFGVSSGGTVNVGIGVTATINANLQNGVGSDFTKVGTGTLVLTQDNSFSGTTTINGGVLQLGNGGSSGSVKGNIVNNAELAFNRADTQQINNTISGSGQVTHKGTGTTILTAANTYDGGTKITSGVLQLGDGGATGSIHGNVEIASGARLSLNRSDDWGLSINLTGTGDVLHRGVGTTTIYGDNCHFGGTTTIAAGKLILDGCVGGGVVVDDGGELDGGDNTVIDDVVINPGGSISPGGSGGGGGGSPDNPDNIDTIIVNNSVTFQPGSTYVVNVNAAGQSDLILVRGEAIINGGYVQAIAAVGNYQPATRYTILTASKGVTLGGSKPGFDRVTSSLAFLTPYLSYDANNVYLTLIRNEVEFKDVTDSFNAGQVGSAVESLGVGNPLYNAIITLDAKGANDAFNQLSGEAYTSQLSVNIEDSKYLREAAMSRINSAHGESHISDGARVFAYNDDGRWSQIKKDKKTHISAWFAPFGSKAQLYGDDNSGAATQSVAGFITGIDIASHENVHLGFLAGYHRSYLDVPTRNSKIESDNYHVGLYGSAKFDALNLGVGGFYTWSPTNASRSIAFYSNSSAVGGFRDSLSASFNMGIAQVFGEASYDIKLNDLKLQPFGNVAYVFVHNDSLTEKGGLAALTMRDGSTNMTFTTLGMRASQDFSLQNGYMISPHIGLAWRHAFGDVNPDGVFSFASGSVPFLVEGLPIAKDAALLDVGLDVKFSETMKVGLAYSGLFAKRSQENSVRANLNWKF